MWLSFIHAGLYKLPSREMVNDMAIWRDYVGTIEACNVGMSIFYDDLWGYSVYEGGAEAGLIYNMYLLTSETVFTKVDTIDVYTAELLDAAYIVDENTYFDTLGLKVEVNAIANPEYVWEEDEGAGEFFITAFTYVGIENGFYKYRLQADYGIASLGFNLYNIGVKFSDPVINEFYQGPTRTFYIVDVVVSQPVEVSGTFLDPVPLVLRAVGN